MFDLIAKVLAWFYELWPSYGMAIVLLTMVVMVLVTPLTLKGTRSMIKMQHLQPEMKKIQNRYKSDRDRMNKEMMAFYQANNINPMGSCMPLFAQAPIFIVLYNVLRGLTRRQSDVGEVAGWAAGRLSSGEAFVAVPDVKRPFFPDYLPEDSLLFQDLSRKTEMVSWGFDLSRSLSRALGDGLVASLPYLLLIIVVFVTSWVMNKQIRGRNKTASANPQQEMIMKIMPFFLPVISFGLDAALVTYFVVSNLYRTGQQAYITRALYGPGQEQPVVVIPTAEADEPKPNKKAGGKSGNTPVAKGGNQGGGSTSGGSDDARSRRTTAGSRSTPNDADTGKARKKGLASAPEPEAEGEKDDKKAAPQRDAKADRRANRRSGRDSSTGRRRRRGGEEPEASDGRPPAARRGGGRTTPPGTARQRGAQNKNRKKRK